MLLSIFLKTVYAVERELSTGYLIDLENTLHVLGQYLGHEPIIADLSRIPVNGFLAWLAENGRRPATVRKHRANLLALWNYAWAIDATEVQPGRIRRPRVTLQPPQAWTLEEITALLDEARRSKRRRKICGIDPRWYWPTLILTLYETGLRIGDTLQMRHGDIAPDGRFSVWIRKTKTWQIKQLSPGTLLEINRREFRDRDELLWPITSRRNFFEQFSIIVARAKIRPGSSKWLRRSSASYVEQQTPGAGQFHLGHGSATTTARHYLDPHIVRRIAPMPPPLVAG